MLKKLCLGIVVLIGLLAVTVVIALVVTAPEPPPPDSNSAQWLEPGPYAVESRDYVFSDSTRRTPANGEYPGAPGRILETTLWYPVNAQGYHPLVIHSHGLVSSRTDLSYMARHLASYGYVVAAADFPLTHGGAPGGANPADVVNQPADVSFLIDSILSLVGEAKPFNGTIDLDRIGLTGYSLGGLTATLTTFHPRQRDSRVSASVSIAGPAALFTRRFFTDDDAAPLTPFLMIAGSADALIDYSANARPIPRLVPESGLLTIRGGTHLGFAALSEPVLRFVEQPDSLGCSAVLATLGGKSSNTIYTDLGTEADGIDLSADIPEVCAEMPAGPVAHPGRQQMITKLGVLSFFESIFAPQAQDRQRAGAELAVFISQDFYEARYSEAR